MIVAMPRLIFIVGLFLILVILGIGLIFARPTIRRALLWVLGIFVLLPVFLFLLLLGVRFSNQPFNVSHPIVITQTVAGIPSVWQDEIEKQFGAEVYSRPQTAAFGLGKQIADRHKELLTGQPYRAEDSDANTQGPKSSGLKKIILCEDTGDLDILQQCRNGLKQSLSNNEILIQSRAASGPSEGQVWILFDSQEEPKTFNVDFAHPVKNAIGFTVEGNKTGVIEAIIQIPDDKFTEQVRYDYREWIHDMPDFQSQYGQQWLAVYSDTATDLEQAQKQVYDKACSILAESIRASGAWPIDIRRENLEQFSLVADSYSQELFGMTGSVWRFALLLNTENEKLTELVQNKTQVAVHQRSTWVQMVLSLAGMIIIICIAYSIANAATKGYYSVLLAVLAVLAAVIVGVILFTGFIRPANF